MLRGREVWFDSVEGPHMSASAYFVRPDGGHFVHVSMGGLPLTYRHDISHPMLKHRVERLNPLVTHLEFQKTQPALLACVMGDASRVIYVYSRALQMVGPQVDGLFLEVALQEPR